MRLARIVCGHLQPFGAGQFAKLLYPYERGKRDEFRFTVKAKTGSMFSGSTADVHAHPVAINGYGDWRNWAVALAVCGPGDVIVEVGANVGTETTGFSDIVGASGRVIAFEPLPAHVETLSEVVRGFRHANVTVLPYAVAERGGQATFAVPPRNASQGIGHLLGPEAQATGTTTYYDRPLETTTIEVERRPLDDFADQLDRLRLLVADAEGSEISIVRGATNILSSARPVLVLEASHPHQRRAGHGIGQLHDELLGLDYRPYVIETLGIGEITDPEATPAHSNWLCLPREQLHLAGRVRGYIRRCGLTPCVLGLNPLQSPAGRRLNR